jgi:hypothetical protein
MNIDKFGHHVHKRLRVSEFSELNDKALLRTENGDFDLQTSRLKGVACPELPNDAVNKQYVDQLFHNIYEKKKLDSLFEIINSQILLLSRQLKLNFYTKKETDDILNRLSNVEKTNSKRNSSVST